MMMMMMIKRIEPLKRAQHCSTYVNRQFLSETSTTTPFLVPPAIMSNLLREYLFFFAIRFVFLLSCVLVWLYYTNESHRICALAAASAFSIIETFWTSIGLSVKKKSLLIGHTTWAQWWANILYTPILLFVYREHIESAYLRIFLFPFNIWLLEIVEGYSLRFIFGRNVAWFYDTKDAFFHGNIRLAYALPWMCLGAIVEVVFPWFLRNSGGMYHLIFPWLAVAVPMTAISEKTIGWPLLGIPNTSDHTKTTKKK